MRGMHNTRLAGMGFGHMHAAKSGAWNPGLLTDPDCVSVYYFEPDDPCADAKGLNDLQYFSKCQFGRAFQHGTGSASFNNGANWKQGIGFTDAELPADWPGKSGTGNATFSFVGWFQYHGGSGAILSKWDGWDAKKTFKFELNSSTSKLRLCIGYNGGSSTESGADLNRALVSGRWYYFGVTHDGATRDWRVRLYDPSVPDTVDLTGTFTNAMVCDDAAFKVCWDDDDTTGNGACITLDHVCIFKDVLSAAEIDDIRTGAKDPTADADILAVWDFDWADFWGDSSGQGMDFAQPTPDTSVIRKQGRTSADLEIALRRDCYARADAVLSAGFPLKNGTANRTYTFTGWWNAESLSAAAYSFPWSKITPSGLIGHALMMTNGQIRFETYLTGGTVTIVKNVTVHTGIWHFFACVWDPAIHKQRLYVWDEQTGALLADDLGPEQSAAEPAIIDDSPFRIGSSDFVSGDWAWDGLLDEFTVWKRALSRADIELIRKGKYKY